MNDRSLRPDGRTACRIGREASRPTRRALLAAPMLLAGPALAQVGDGSLARVVGNGLLRVNTGFLQTEFADQVGEVAPRMRDAFHEGMARLIAERLGVRAELRAAGRSGDGMHPLLAGEVDLALAAPLTREALRTIMFCTPHLSLGLVMLGRGMGGNPGRAAPQGRRVATLTMLTAALAEHGALGDLPSLIPISDPWVLTQALRDGQVDGAVVTSVMARSLIRRFPDAGLRSLFTLSNNVFAGAVAYGDHDLLRALNRIIEGLQLDGSLSGLFRQETGMTLIPPFPS